MMILYSSQGNARDRVKSVLLRANPPIDVIVYQKKMEDQYLNLFNGTNSHPQLFKPRLVICSYTIVLSVVPPVRGNLSSKRALKTKYRI